MKLKDSLRKAKDKLKLNSLKNITPKSPNKISIKWKLFLYFIVFTSLLIFLLWLFQIVFLEDMYRSIKIKSIDSYAESLGHSIIDGDSNKLYQLLYNEDEMDIRITSPQSIEEGFDILSMQNSANSLIHKLSRIDTLKYYSIAANNGGTYYTIRSKQDLLDDRITGDLFSGKILPYYDSPGEAIIYVKLISTENDSKAMIMLSTDILPVTSTVDTLRIQLTWITFIFIGLSLLLALFISKRISTPIVKINTSAKELAKGNYDTTFNGKGYREITELNDTLNYAAKELSKVESLRRELIANISHDLRTPLTLITGYGEVMRDLPGENTPENVQIIIDEAKRLTTLVNDVLDISKFQSGNQQLKLSLFNLTDTVRSILLRYTKLTEQDGYNITFTANEDVFVEADEIKITQVIYNLINNAITYTGSDKTVKLEQVIENDSVKIQVIDSGEGISEENLPLIWDRYYKVSKAHKRAAIGTGLGLSIVKEILQLHKAEFGVTSKLGEGSCFWFKLKIQRGEEDLEPYC